MTHILGKTVTRTHESLGTTSHRPLRDPRSARLFGTVRLCVAFYGVKGERKKGTLRENRALLKEYEALLRECMAL